MTTKDATQPGVSEELEQDPNTPAAEAEGIQSTNEQRVSELDDIAGRNEAAMLEELGIEPKEPETPPEPKAGEETPAGETPPATETPPTHTIVELDPAALVQVTVDGQEVIKPWGEVKKEFQLEQAARKRMEDAARRQKELDERETALAERERQQQPPETKQTPATQDKIREAVDAMYQGESDKAVELFAELMQTGRQPEPATPEQKIDVEQLAALAEARIEEKTALKQFAKEYKDVVSDPYLAELADRFRMQALEENPNLPFAETLEKAGQATRDWMKQHGLGATPATEPSREAKLQKKEGIDTVPTLSVVPSEARKPSEEQDRLSAVEEIRKARGQAG